ncbi:MAG: hypothetical protein PVJ92_00390 [Candidatus Dependentiae bacterium]
MRDAVDKKKLCACLVDKAVVDFCGMFSFLDRASISFELVRSNLPEGWGLNTFFAQLEVYGSLCESAEIQHCIEMIFPKVDFQQRGAKVMMAARDLL